MTARRPEARTEEAYQNSGTTGSLDKRPHPHYYAAVVPLNAVSAHGKERPMPKVVLDASDASPLEQNKRTVVEFYDVVQPMPEKAANPNGMS